MKKDRPENTRGLLGRFIQEKIRNYVAPSREGTPRGEPIGFSPEKYGASLYGLTNIKQKEIAQNLEISHGVLRKWHTEEPFQALIDRHCREFAGVFIANLRDRIKRSEALNNSFLAQSLREIASQDIPHIDYRELSDADMYSLKLFLHINDALDIETKKAQLENDVAMQFEIIATLGAITSYCRIKESSQKKPPQSEDIEKKFMNRLLKSIAEKSIQILLKPVLDEEDKKELLTTIKILTLDLE